MLELSLVKLASLRRLMPGFPYWLAYAGDFLGRVGPVDRPFALEAIRKTGDDAFLAAAEIRYNWRLP